MAVLGGHLFGSLDTTRSAGSAPHPPPSAASLPPSIRPPFRRPPALDIVTSSDSIEDDDDYSVPPPLVGEESSDESADRRSGDTSDFAKNVSSDSVACGFHSRERAPVAKNSSVSPARQHGQHGIPAESSTADRDYAEFDDSTPSAASVRPPPSPHHPRDATSGGALGAFVGGSLRAVERTMGRAALKSGGAGNNACAAPAANARPRSGGGGMRSLSRGSSSSAIHHVRRNSTGAHAAGFDVGRAIVRAESTIESSDRTLQSPGAAERSASVSCPWSHGPHTGETATVSSGSFSFYHGDSNTTASSGNNSSSAGGWGSMQSLWRSLHAPVSPIFRPKRHSANPWDHPATATSTHAASPWDHHTSPSFGTSGTNSTASSDAGSNGVHGGCNASNGAGSTANKPPRRHRWTSADWSHWAGPIFPGARCPAASTRRNKSFNHIPATTFNHNHIPATTLAPMHVPMHVLASPGVLEPSIGAPPLLRRSRTEETCETRLDYSVASHHGRFMRERAASHEAWVMSATLHEAFNDSTEALKDPGRRRTREGASGGSFSEGCIPLAPGAVGGLGRAKGGAPLFLPATEHRLFCGLDNDPPRFPRASMSLPRLQPASTHQALMTEMPAQPEPAQKLPLQNLPAQDLQKQQPPTQHLQTQRLPTQHLPVQGIVAAAEVAVTGGSRMHAPAASACDLPLHSPTPSKCDLHSHTSPDVKGSGGQEEKLKQVDYKPAFKLKAEIKGEQRDWQPPSPTPMPRQTHRRRMRRVGSESDFWVDCRTESDEDRRRRRSRGEEMGGGPLEPSDMIVRSPDSGWCKVGGLHSWSPEHGKGGGTRSGGNWMFVMNGGDRRSEGVSMANGLTALPVAAEGQRHVEVNSRSAKLEPVLLVTETMSEAAGHLVSCDGISSPSSNCLASKSGGSGGRQDRLMSPLLPCEELRGEEIQSVQCMSTSIFLGSGARQNWRPAMNHPLFSGRAVGVYDDLFSP